MKLLVTPVFLVQANQYIPSYVIVYDHSPGLLLYTVYSLVSLEESLEVIES